MAVSLAVSTHGTAHAEIAEDARWSVDFDAVSLQEAFDRLTQVTGVKIFTTTPLVHTISPKRYMNQSVEQILKDLLKQVNYATVWHYGKGGIESVRILAFDLEMAESPGSISQVNKEAAIRHSRPSSAVSGRIHPRAQRGGLDRGENIAEPASEPENTEAGEAGTSDLASSEPAEDLPNGEGGANQEESEQ